MSISAHLNTYKEGQGIHWSWRNDKLLRFCCDNLTIWYVIIAKIVHSVGSVVAATTQFFRH